jgi:hypothetical protein
MADTKRLVELALKGLEIERRQIDDEIANLQRQLRGGGMRAPARPVAGKAQSQPSQAPQRRSRLSAAGRKALSDAMKRRWAVKKKAMGRAK